MLSSKCKFGKSCQVEMCQFTHEECVSEIASTVTTPEENELEKLPDGEIYCYEWELKNIRDCCEIVLDECDSVHCIACASKICKECSEFTNTTNARKTKSRDKIYCSKCLKTRLVQTRTASSSSSRRVSSVGG